MPSLGFPLAGPLGGGGAFAPVVSTNAPFPFVPAGPLASALGTDLSCLSDLDPSMALVSGNTMLAQALLRRLLTGRSALVYAPEYGRDIRSYLNATLDNRVMARLATDVERELEKDERVQSVSASCSLNSSTQVLTLSIVVTSRTGPFRLTLAIDQLGVSLLEAA